MPINETLLEAMALGGQRAGGLQGASRSPGLSCWLSLPPLRCPLDWNQHSGAPVALPAPLASWHLTLTVISVEQAGATNTQKVQQLAWLPC